MASWYEIIKPGNVEAVRNHIAQGADVNAKTDWGKTMLMCAAMGGNPDLVRLLLEAGADVNAKDDRGITALDYARENGHNDIAEMLKKTDRNKQREA